VSKPEPSKKIEPKESNQASSKPAEQGNPLAEKKVKKMKRYFETT
jgi:hypothetical protein